MKIIITERQLEKIISESEGCPCGDGTSSVECCNVSADVSDSLKIINKAIDLGLDIRHRGKTSYETWDNVSKKEGIPVSYFKDVLPNEYETYVPEIISGLLRGVKFDTRLVDILKEIEDKSGVEIEITGGQDKYHTWGYHGRGKAIDFVPLNGGMNNETDSKIESAILDIILSGKYGEEIGYINERLKKTKKGTGPHYHLSLDSTVEGTRFGMVDRNGVVHKTPQYNSLSWGKGKFPKNLSKMVEDNIFNTFRVKMSNKEFCDKLIELDNYTPDYVDRLPKDIYDGDVRKKLRKCKMPTLSKLPIKNVTKIDNNVNIPNEIVRDEYMYELFKEYDLENMSKIELKKLVKKVKEDGREDLSSTIKRYIPTPLKDLYDIYIRK